MTTQAQAQELVCRAVRTVVLDVSRENCRCYLSSLLMGCVMTRHGICLESEIQDALSQSTAEDFHKRLDDVVVPSFCNDVIHSLLGHMTELEQYNQLCEQVRLASAAIASGVWVAFVLCSHLGRCSAWCSR